MPDFRLPLDYKEKVGRAVHDIPAIKRTTPLPGLLVPLYARRMKRGETFIFSNPQMLLQSLPTLAPVLGSWRFRIEWYFNSDANHYGWIDNNARLSTEEMLARKHHTFSPNCYDIGFLLNVSQNRDNYPDLYEELTNCKSYGEFLRRFGIGRGSLMDYMGVAPGTIPRDVEAAPGNVDLCSDYNLDFILTYLNIIRCYHINQQFPTIPYTKKGIEWYRGDDSADPVFGELAQSDLDNFFMWLRYCSNGVDIKTIFEDDFFGDINPEDFEDWSHVNQDIPDKYRLSVLKVINYLRCVNRENCGLFCSQYATDLWRNLLANDANLLKSEVTTNGDGSFSIETFRFKNRLQMIYDRIQPFGAKDSTIARTRWGVSSNRDYDIPELISVHTEFIDTSAITSSNAGTASNGNGEVITSIPGELSGYTNQRKYSNAKQKFTANTPGTLMAIVSLVPQVDYCQNTEPYLTTFNFEDEFSPQMAQRGFESVPQLWYSSLPLVNFWNIDGDLDVFDLYNEGDLVVGKQVAWLNDISSVNRVHGEFARFGDLDYWVLSRDFMNVLTNIVDEGEDYRLYFESIFEYSPYVNPLKWQYMFVGQTIDDSNWYLQVMFDVKTISPVGYRFMPTLE